MPDPSAGIEQQKPVAVVYGGSVPSARVIAERLAAGFQRRGFPAQLCFFPHAATVDLGRFAAAVVLAPVPLGQEEKSLLEFVKAQKEHLECMPVAFLSMSVAGESREGSRKAAQQSEDPPEKSAQFVADTSTTLDRLAAETGWRPTRQWPIAGSITYVRYNSLVRFILKFLAKGSVGHSGRRDDWQALENFLDEFEAEIRAAGTEGPTEIGPGKT